MHRGGAPSEVHAPAYAQVKDVSPECQSFIHVTVRTKRPENPKCNPECSSNSTCVVDKIFGIGTPTLSGPAVSPLVPVSLSIALTRQRHASFGAGIPVSKPTCKLNTVCDQARRGERKRARVDHGWQAEARHAAIADPGGSGRVRERLSRELCLCGFQEPVPSGASGARVGCACGDGPRRETQVPWSVQPTCVADDAALFESGFIDPERFIPGRIPGPCADLGESRRSIFPNGHGARTAGF
jgi:hypothetical protein